VKIHAAFAHYRDQLADADLRALDVDIKLVGEAIAEDLGSSAASQERKVGP